MREILGFGVEFGVRWYTMGQVFFQVDAFADRPFSGNPAAICILSEPREVVWMQSLALENNISETAYLVRRDDGSYDLRWFTPVAEVDLCGHATLAAAHILWEQGLLGIEEHVRFHTRSGLLTAERAGDAIEMICPACPIDPSHPWVDDVDIAAKLGAVLGVAPVFVGCDGSDILVELATEAEVRALEPDLNGIAALPARGVIVTSRSEGGEFDFISRFFAPALGINEDPATGSAHCCLAPYWSGKLGKDAMNAYQASPRGGVVHVALDGDRVRLSGHAVTVLRAELTDIADG